MTLTIFHGDDHLSSRKELRQTLDQMKAKGFQIRYLDGEKIAKKDLETQLCTNNFFVQEVVVIENLLSRPRSQAKLQCLQYLVHFSGPKDIYLWERKKISATTLKSLSPQQPQIKEYQTPPLIFKFLDSLTPQNKSQLLSFLHTQLLPQKLDPTFIFIMLNKRVSQLIIAKSSPQLLTGASWQKNKLINQAKVWTLPKLLHLHQRLFTTDLHLKTGRSQLDMIDNLDLIILEL